MTFPNFAISIVAVPCYAVPALTGRFSPTARSIFESFSHARKPTCSRLSRRRIRDADETCATWRGPINKLNYFRQDITRVSFESFVYRENHRKNKPYSKIHAHNSGVRGERTTVAGIINRHRVPCTSRHETFSGDRTGAQPRERRAAVCNQKPGLKITKDLSLFGCTFFSPRQTKKGSFF